MKLEDEVRRIIRDGLPEYRALYAIAKAYDDLRTEIGMGERLTALELAALVRERGLAGP